MMKSKSANSVSSLEYLGSDSNATDHSTNINTIWAGSSVGSESTLHQISPYIGKMKSTMARALVELSSRKGDLIYDPFCGSGTIAFETWASGRHIIANDLSPYAAILNKAKLFPTLSVEQSMIEIDDISEQVSKSLSNIDLRKIPTWVRSFFHSDTLREIIIWINLLHSRKSHFLLSCLLGILHHQRPGFLSYPSSHAVPYLRNNKFPREDFPELYEYREVKERLKKKVIRTLRRVPILRQDIHRECIMKDARNLHLGENIDTIITSPPYMGKLDYGRDNRLRQWFLGVEDFKELDSRISPSETSFLDLIRACLKLWKKTLKPGGNCILVLGDNKSNIYKKSLPAAITHIATNEIGGYSLSWKYTEPIPDDRRVRKDCRGNIHETILVLRNRGC